MQGVRHDTGEELLPPVVRSSGSPTSRIESLFDFKEQHQVNKGSESVSTAASSTTPTTSPTEALFNEEACSTCATLASQSPSFREHMDKKPTAVVIGIRGKWYDVTDFRHRHPGGALLLEKCHGKDCTEMYDAFHEKDFLKWFPSIGTYDERDPHQMRKRFRDLGEEFQKMGLFNSSMSWYIRKVIFVLSCFAVSVWIIRSAPVSGSVSNIRALIAGVLLGLFWQQCGFMMHDAMHSDVTHTSFTDRAIGILFGSVLLGVSAHWWRDEHFEHHAFTNVIEADGLYGDPQMIEEVWVQDRVLFPTLVSPRSAIKRIFQHLFLRVQGWCWVVLAMLFGRVAIAIDALHVETRWYEWVAVICHNIWMGFFLYKHFDSPLAAFIYWYTGAVFEGILHVQLLVNHYPKPWVRMEDLTERVNWPQLQTRSTINIKTPWWIDWFYGGLNYHIEHHLYPNMPRNNFSKAQPHVKKLCKEVGLPYDEANFIDSILDTCKKMHVLSRELHAWWGGPVYNDWVKWFETKDNKNKKID